MAVGAGKEISKINVYIRKKRNELQFSVNKQIFMSKVLVAYFSALGVTERVVRQLADVTHYNTPPLTGNRASS